MNAGGIFNAFKEQKLEVFYGVPDSLLKNLSAYLMDYLPAERHIITANEGNAIAMACGYYLATGKFATVYMQNSGLGNCVNPLLSLADEDVYHIPFLMIIGWRGEPHTKDEPQHVKQGKITDKLLETMGIKYEVIPKDIECAKKSLKRAVEYMNITQKPFAFLVQKDAFESYERQTVRSSEYTLSREDAIFCAASFLSKGTVVVATTGHISRELYEYRSTQGQGHCSDFLTVGAMGHASSIALAIALEKKEQTVACFDGDGAFLMHMGAMPVIAAQNLSNFKHLIFNNEAHDSVGGQPTCANTISISGLALASGYKKIWSVSSREDLCSAMPEFLAFKGTTLIEIRVRCGAREDLGRPKEKPAENKYEFMKFMGSKA